MEYPLSPNQQKIKELSRLFALQEIIPYVQKLEEDVAFRRQLFQKMSGEGLFLLSTQNDTLAYMLSLKEIAKADAGICVAMAVTNMVAEAIARYGSEKQKSTFLSKIQSGESVPAAFALTEKLAGSDVKNLQMEAVRKENVYILSGEKHLITNGDLAGILLVLARVPGAGISAFLVEKGTPGISVLGKEEKLGLLTAHLVRLKFDNCQILVDNLLGKEGNGLKIALSSLDNGRLGIAAQSLGIGEAAFEAALEYAKNRIQFNTPLISHQANAFKLADMQVSLSAGECLLRHACWAKDQDLDIRSLAAQAKLFTSEAANTIATQALQIFGGYGYIKANPVEKYFRDARATTIYEGTSEMQRLVISRLL